MEVSVKPYIVVLVVAITMSVLAHPVQAQREEPLDPSSLSPYWHSDVSRWERIIVQYAEQRHMDPDFVASVIWKESRGDSTVRGPTGAVGLMCVQPYPWRPSADALQNPWTNVDAGTKTLGQVIRDGNGDVYYALAAYNGGWDQIHIRITRAYATDVLDNYARAVAVEHGLAADGDWIAIISVEGLPNHKTVTVLRPGRSLARYTERPWRQGDIPSVPAALPPHATLIAFTDGSGREARVDLWLVAEESALEGSSAALPTLYACTGPTSASHVPNLDAGRLSEQGPSWLPARARSPRPLASVASSLRCPFFAVQLPRVQGILRKA